jgi:hypothetical protein
VITTSTARAILELIDVEHLGGVFPVLPIPDVVDRASAIQPILFGECIASQTTISSSKDLHDLRVCELGLRDRSISFSISHVLLWRALIDMAHTVPAFVRAVVAGIHAFLERSAKTKLKSNSVCSLHIGGMSVSCVKHSVARLLDNRSGPKPARHGLFDLGPEPFFKRLAFMQVYTDWHVEHLTTGVAT